MCKITSFSLHNEGNPTLRIMDYLYKGAMKPETEDNPQQNPGPCKQFNLEHFTFMQQEESSRGNILMCLRLIYSQQMIINKISDKTCSTRQEILTSHILKFCI